MAFISKLRTLKAPIPRILLLRSYPHSRKSLKPIWNESSIQVRFKSMFPRFKVNEESFKIKDNIPDSFNLIYRNTMSNYLLLAQIASFVSAGIIGLYAWYADSTGQGYEPNMTGWREQPLAVENEIVVYIISILTVSVALQYFIRKMPIRIYNFKDEKFVFVYYHVFPFTSKQYRCGIKEIRKLPKKLNPILPWTDIRYDVHRNYGVILVDEFFKSPAELNIMLGIQKRYVEPEEEEE